MLLVYRITHKIFLNILITRQVLSHVVLLSLNICLSRIRATSMKHCIYVVPQIWNMQHIVLGEKK